VILRLVMIGFGSVGQGFAKLLLSKRDWLLRVKGLDVEVLGIATKSHGSLLSTKALDLDHVLKHLKDHNTLVGYGPESTDLTPTKMINACDADLMVELTTLAIDSGQPAIDHIKAAFDMGMDVITANKGPIAYAYKDLRNSARSRGVHLRFEGTVMDGTPVFSLVEKTLQGCTITGLEGILNSTSNFVLTEMSEGKTMQQAIKKAQARGFAEADPSLDIDGWDAAAKIAALANVIMDADSTPKDVEREGIREVSRDDVKRATSEGRRIKMIASASPTADKIRLSVRPELIGPESPYWSVEGTSSALTIKTDLMGNITIVESDPQVTQTAYAVFSDMLLIVESIRSGTL